MSGGGVAGILLILLLVVALFIAASCVKIVPQASAYVVESLGKYKDTWATGLHFKVPFIERVAIRVNLKEQVVDFPPQPVITKDNVTMQIDTVVFFQITDPKLFAYGVVNPLMAIENLTATTLRNIIGEMELDETLEVARILQNECGAHALILSGGFVSRAPMYVMRGSMPIHTMTHYMPFGWLPLGVKMAGRFMIPSEPFKEAYFLEDALKFRAALKMPLVYVGGLISREKIDEVLNDGFEFVSMARALLNDPSFVNKMKEDEHARCDCGHSNYCIARMYSIEMACHKHIQNLPKSIVKEIEKLEYK